MGPVPVAPLECDVELTYVANAGVLLRHGDRQVLIDGLHRPYGEAYAVLPEAERGALERAESRWSEIDLIVATHEHGDHTSPEAVASHLAANPDARFVAPPAVAQKVAAIDRQLAGRIHSVPWGPGSSARIPGVDGLEIYNLRHAGRFEAMESIGVVVTIDEVSVFHPGDADADAGNFAPFSAQLRQLDVALLPTWFLGDDNPIEARRIFAIHIDPRAADRAAARIASTGAIPLTEMLASRPLCE